MRKKTVMGVLGMLLIAVVTSKCFAGQLQGQSDGSTSNNDRPDVARSAEIPDGWQINRQRDKLTDEISVTAYKVYPLENGHIEVLASCGAYPYGVFRAEEVGAQFEFTYFNSENPNQSAYELENDVVPILFRLNDDAIQSYSLPSEYKNLAKLHFLNEQYKKLLESKLLRVRLPLLVGPDGTVAGPKADIEIQLSDLYGFFSNECKIACQTEQEPVWQNAPATMNVAPFGSPEPVKVIDDYGGAGKATVERTTCRQK